MHSCIYLYTKDFPSDEVIEKMMEPYYEYCVSEDEVLEKPFQWDGFEIGGRYCGKIKLNATKETEERYEWMFYLANKRAGRLFRSSFLERVAFAINDRYTNGKIAEEEALLVMGIRDGFIRVDGAWLPDVVNRDELKDNCFGILTDDGTVLMRKVWKTTTCSFGSKHSWVDTPDFDARASLVMERCKNDHYLTVIDIHI